MLKKHFCLSFVLLLAVAGSLQAQYATLHHFTGPTADGKYPYASPIRKGNMLYRMTGKGGAYNNGAIFKIGLDGTGYALLHSPAVRRMDSNRADP